MGLHVLGILLDGIAVYAGYPFFAVMSFRRSISLLCSTMALRSVTMLLSTTVFAVMSFRGHPLDLYLPKVEHMMLASKVHAVFDIRV